MASFRLELDSAAIDDLAFGADAEDVTQEAGDAVAAIARRLAPKRTGAGARSIRAEVAQDADGAYAEVSWSPAFSYMRFNGPFLVPALNAARID